MCIGKAFADCICMCYLCVQERYHTFFFTPANGWCTFLCNSALSVRVLRLKRDIISDLVAPLFIPMDRLLVVFLNVRTAS